jgi:hypothetical protein
VQDVYGLAVEVKHVKPGDQREIHRLRRELDLICSRSEFSKVEEICSRLRHLREQFEQDVALLLRCSHGDPRWQQLFWLLEEREGRIIRLVNDCTTTMGQSLEVISNASFLSRGRATSASVKSAEESSFSLLSALRELREIRDRIFGLSGQAGFLELTEPDPNGLRTAVQHLAVQIKTGDTYNTNVTSSTLGALALGAAASASGLANTSKA